MLNNVHNYYYYFFCFNQTVIQFSHRILDISVLNSNLKILHFFLISSVSHFMLTVDMRAVASIF